MKGHRAQCQGTPSRDLLALEKDKALQYQFYAKSYLLRCLKHFDCFKRQMKLPYLNLCAELRGKALLLHQC